MKLSQAGLEFIKRAEGCRLMAYEDSSGVLTIGYGSTMDVGPGEQITMAQAEERLIEDLEDAERAIERFVKVPLEQNQYDALVSFIFNIGAGNFRNSTLLKKLNQRDFEGAADEFPRWVHAGGAEVTGLKTRREREMAMFEGVG